MSYGELLSSLTISAAFQSLEADQSWVDSRKLIATNSNHGNAAVVFAVTNQKIQTILPPIHINCILPGFISSDELHNTTTLGRGGSDYTAAIFAAACQLLFWKYGRCKWYDDCRSTPCAKCQTHSKDIIPEAMELSHLVPRSSIRQPFSR